MQIRYLVKGTVLYYTILYCTVYVYLSLTRTSRCVSRFADFACSLGVGCFLKKFMVSNSAISGFRIQGIGMIKNRQYGVSIKAFNTINDDIRRALARVALVTLCIARREQGERAALQVVSVVGRCPRRWRRCHYFRSLCLSCGTVSMCVETCRTSYQNSTRVSFLPRVVILV
jgi:hypothetical protein